MNYMHVEHQLRTNIVLIDFESVQPDSLAALVGDHFKLIVFVGANQSKLSTELAMAIQQMGDKAEYVKISGNGPNALDFHIAFYIGQLAARDPSAYFHIISKDTGFDPLIQHLKGKQIFSARSSTIAEMPVVKAALTKSPKERLQLFSAHLNKPKVTKPRTEKTLASAISSFFQKQISDDEIREIILQLDSNKVITVIDGKVSYLPSAET